MHPHKFPKLRLQLPELFRVDWKEDENRHESTADVADRLAQDADGEKKILLRQVSEMIQESQRDGPVAENCDPLATARYSVREDRTDNGDVLSERSFRSADSGPQHRLSLASSFFDDVPHVVFRDPFAS